MNYVYGTFENPFAKPKVREKIRQTMIDRYGAATTLESKILHDKQINTMLRLYGGTNTFDSPALRHKFDFKKWRRNAMRL